MTGTKAASLQIGGLRTLAARRPLTTFLLAGLFIIWPVAWLIPLSAHDVVPGFGEWLLSPLIILYFLIVVGIIWAAEGKTGVLAFLARIVRWRFGIGWWVAIAAGLPALAICFNLALGASFRTEGLGEVLLRQAWAAVVTGMLLVNLWEEAVWAGFLQTRLERTRRILPAAWLAAIPFVIIHIPLQFVGAFDLASVAIGILALFIFALFFRPMMAFALRGSGDSLLAVGLFHAVFNITSSPTGLVAALTPGVDPVGSTLFATVVMTVGMGLAVRTKLSRAYRLEVLEAR
ncbi:CPBP family intramembrane glutamic endopeptidase [Sphingosinicella rhizophila]|uniref:Lysostaphin resistance A-like protein n=1 Tax=Sphingosinicella rhizophila TaxID=3050082 RepID=A0ABU3QB01_9SPHN|nr:CPBP family intramembrane glutamic endopeptidase [Sphingosinicella sp. GR2756]MDT9600577.1 lysostaphin resistance A-like protein [Sphingosinicella sp. GR2756]